MKLKYVSLVLGAVLLTACSTSITTSRADEVEKVHKENLVDIFELDFDALESRFSKEFKILDSKSGKTVDFIAELKEDADSNNPVFQKDINELFDLKNVYVFDYDQMVENGIAENISILMEGDYFARVNPKEGVSKEYGIEELTLLYRKIDGNWIAIGGTR